MDESPMDQMSDTAATNYIEIEFWIILMVHKQLVNNHYDVVYVV